MTNHRGLRATACGVLCLLFLGIPCPPTTPLPQRSPHTTCSAETSRTKPDGVLAISTIFFSLGFHHHHHELVIFNYLQHTQCTTHFVAACSSISSTPRPVLTYTLAHVVELAALATHISTNQALDRAVTRPTVSVPAIHLPWNDLATTRAPPGGLDDQTRDVMDHEIIVLTPKTEFNFCTQ